MNALRARNLMVQNQIRANQVTDRRVVDAFADVPRERFAPDAETGLAYADTHLELGRGRWLPEPRVLARLLDAARVGPGDAALDVACATGYATALLAALAALAVGVESDPQFHGQAVQNLEQLEISNALVLQGEPERGAPGHAPYDVVLIAAAVARPPRALLEQLAEGGRLVAVLRPRRQPVGTAVLFQRHGDQFPSRPLFDAHAPYLPEFAPENGFVF